METMPAFREYFSHLTPMALVPVWPPTCRKRATVPLGCQLATWEQPSALVSQLQYMPIRLLLGRYCNNLVGWCSPSRGAGQCGCHIDHCNQEPGSHL